MKANSLINEDELYLVEGTNEVNINEATETESGLMSAADKVKLNGIEEEANKTIIDSVLNSTSTNPVQNQVINAKFDEIEASIAGKVDAVDGKGLSTNDLTSTLKSNYDSAYTHSQQPHASADAEKNVIIGIQKNGADLTVNSSTRKVNITVPTKTSDLNNDSNFATVTDVNNAKITVDSTLSSTSGNPVQNKVINSKFDEIKASIDSKVPSTRTVNGKNLSSNITLNASDVGALPDTTVIPSIKGLATETYVDNKVSGLINSAPEALDTLNELATALGNDPNFATTIATQIGGKVDKINGKGLSTIDYTTAEKNKLASIDESAEVNQNAFSNVIIGTTTIAADNKTDSLTFVAGNNVTLTPDAANDKITISAIDTTYGEAGTNLGLVKSGGDVTISSGIITVKDDSHNHTIGNIDNLQSAIDSKVDKVEGSRLITTSEASKLESLVIGEGGQIEISGKVNANNVEGLSELLDTKVDKVTGKGLSTNDLTGTLKSNYDTAYTHSQQAHAPSDAEKNIIVGIQKNGTNLSVDSTTRKVNITVPTKTSDITNDSDYATNSSVDSKLSGKVDVVSGKGLSTNDYTTNEKNKLSGIAVGADVSTIKSISKNGTALSIDSSKNVNIEVPTKISQLSNDSGYLTEHQNISGKADKATTLSGYGITDAYTQTQVDDKLSVKANKATTLAGYGITDAKISSGTITLGSNSITPVTDISGKQDTITGAATTITSSNLTTNRALISNGSGKVAVSNVSSTELGYLVGVNDGVQSQLNAKAPLASPALTGTPTAPTADASVNNTQIATTAYVKTAINNVLNASNAMVFKGTIGTSGSVTSLPASHQVGDVYVVSTAGSYAGQTCEVGDMIVCTITGTASKNSDWTVVQSNINGAVTGPSSSVNSHVAIFDGSTGKVIKDSGFTIGTNVPSNAVFTDTVYTHPSYTAKTGVPTANQTPSFGGTFTVTQPVSDATGHIVEMNSRTVTIPNTTASASVNGLMTSADKTKLDTIAEGAEVNQNAFNKVTVGSTTIEADSKTDTLTIIAGDNVTLTPDATNDKITIASKDTIYTHPSYTARTGVPTENQTPAFGGTFSVSQPVSDSTGHITSINSRTVKIPSTTATTSANGLMSSSDKTKLNGISTNAKNIIVSGTQPTNQSVGDFWYKVV